MAKKGRSVSSFDLEKRFHYLIRILKCYPALLVFLGVLVKMHLN